MYFYFFLPLEASELREDYNKVHILFCISWHSSDHLVYRSTISLVQDSALCVGSVWPARSAPIYFHCHHKFHQSSISLEPSLDLVIDNYERKIVVCNCLLSSLVKVLKIFKFGDICDDEKDIEEQIEQVKHFLKTMSNLE